MSINTDGIDKGMYIVANGAVGMFGCTNLEVIGGGSNIDNALKAFNETEPIGTVIDYSGHEARKHTYLMIILKAKVEGKE
jgi:hypothetical protein